MLNHNVELAATILDRRIQRVYHWKFYWTVMSSVQLLSCVWLFATPCTTARQASLSITNSQSLLKLMSIETGMPLNYLILCHPLLLQPSVFPSINWLVWSPCSLRDSQESSPTPQFKSINSVVLSFLYSPTLTSIHDHWKNHSFD